MGLLAQRGFNLTYQLNCRNGSGRPQIVYRQAASLLKDEEDLARELLHLFEESQQVRAIIAKEAPRDIITGTGREVSIGEPAGLPASDMNEAQRGVLVCLVELFAHTVRQDLAEANLERIQVAGIDNLHFAWAGDTARGEQHYYRIHGPTVLIEYDNTQNDANHIHSVMRDLDNDFGIDLLRKHYEDSDHPR